MAIANYLYLSAILFTIGAIGVVVRRNAIVVFMCIELMLNAANLAFVPLLVLMEIWMDKLLRSLQWLLRLVKL